MSIMLCDENRLGSEVEEADRFVRKQHPKKLPPLDHRSPMPPVVPRCGANHTRPLPLRLVRRQSGSESPYQHDVTLEQDGTVQNGRSSHDALENSLTESGTMSSSSGRTMPSLGGRTLTAKLGRGGFGQVFLCINTETGEREAAKFIVKSKPPSKVDVDVFMKEYHIGFALHHPNIAKTKQVMQTSGFIVMFVEFAGSENLCARLNGSNSGLPLGEVWAFQSQLLGAIEYCHSVNVAHLDIKPENVMVWSGCDNSPVLKLIDFGCAVQGKHTFSSIVGTMPFIAPEVLIYNSSSPFSADMWSCGVVMLEMLSGTGALNRIMGWEKNLRPEKRYGKQLVQAIHYERPTHELVSREIPTECSDILRGLLCPEVASRMNGKEAREEMAIALWSLVCE